MSPDLPDLITKDELCSYLRIGKTTLWELMRKKEIPYIRLKRRVLFKRTDIEKWIESRKIR